MKGRINMDKIITETISFAKMVKIVDVIFDTVFPTDEKGNRTGGYKPEYKDYALRSAIISSFTNFDILEENGYEMLYKDNFNKVYNDLIQNNSQVKTIIKAVDDKINHYLRHLESGFSLTDIALTKLFDKATELLDNLQEGFTSVDISELTSLLGSFTETVTDSKSKDISVSKNVGDK